MAVNSYPSIYNLGHRAVANIFDTPVVAQEKVDGSQFSFGWLEDNKLHARSKGREILIDAPDKMFAPAINYIKTLPAMAAGFVFRCEFLGKPKHNTLAYNRIPKNHLVLFDVETPGQRFCEPFEIEAWASTLGIEAVPDFTEATLHWTEEAIRELLQRESFLGGPKVEGIVFKNYSMYGPDKKVLMAKYVSEEFKEIHQKSWKTENPSKGDVVQNVAAALRTDARWNKAVQHLRDDGVLTGTPADIGKLVAAVGEDLDKEATDFAKEELFKWGWPQIRRGALHGIAEWYKGELLKAQFEGDEDNG